MPKRPDVYTKFVLDKLRMPPNSKIHMAKESLHLQPTQECIDRSKPGAFDQCVLVNAFKDQYHGECVIFRSSVYYKLLTEKGQRRVYKSVLRIPSQKVLDRFDREKTWPTNKDGDPLPIILSPIRRHQYPAHRAAVAKKTRATAKAGKKKQFRNTGPKPKSLHLRPSLTEAAQATHH